MPGFFSVPASVAGAGQLGVRAHMAVACPHCGANYIPFRDLWMHVSRLAGSSAPIACPGCERFSYVDVTGRSGKIGMGFLVCALLASFPSPLSDAILSGVEPSWLAIVRVEIWAFATLIAFSLLIFSRPLARSNAPPGAAPQLRGWAKLIRLFFMTALFGWGFILWLGLTDAP